MLPRKLIAILGGGAEPPPSPLPLTFSFAGYGISASPPGDMEFIQIPAGLITDYGALGLTVPTLPDYFGDLASKLTNESDEGTGTPSFYWMPVNAAVNGARLIYYKFVAAGELVIDLDIDPVLGATSIDVLTTASGNNVNLRTVFSDTTTSSVYTFADTPLNAESIITFTATGGRIITALRITWPAGGDAGISISQIVLSD